jgi:hypothetical protein
MCVFSRCLATNARLKRHRVFTVPLPSNGRLFLLNYSGFQPVCHNSIKIVWGGEIFGPEREEMTGEWRKLHNEELHNFYSSPNIMRVIKSGKIWWAGRVVAMRPMRNAHKVTVGKPAWKITIRKPCCRWEDNIKVGWIQLAQNRVQWLAVVSTILNRFRPPPSLTGPQSGQAGPWCIAARRGQL